MPVHPICKTGDHHRRSLRLPDYDYAQAGAYFVTACAQNRKRLFGIIVDGAMRLNDAGIIVHDVWIQTQQHYPSIDLDAFVIMPNHFHGIVVVGAGYSRPLPGYSRPLPEKHKQEGREDRKEGREDRAPTLGNIVGYFKYQSTKQINTLRNAGFEKLWQRNYYDHVIRDDDDLNRIREYITNNPATWLQDELYA